MKHSFDDHYIYVLNHILFFGRKHFLQEYLEILDYFVHKLYRISSFSESEYFHILKSLSKNKYLQVNSILAQELLTPYVCGQSCHFGVFIGLNEIVVFFD